ncbi:nuclear speckle RNA-binding protein A-like [Iris pallida]|uniref:Nuclear speckle RNA-binding protein A-like n=1 Tax=Iris pallida TaxID=29817 RepID=A0AAX6DS99_IRIPA|nr:nuclear speckle RNA-binding protein A-like [Iris pallida]
MTDPYYKYSPLERDPRYASAFPGYLPSEGSAIAPRHFLDSSNLRAPSVYPQNDMLSMRSRYGLDDLPAGGTHVPAGIGGLSAGANFRGFTPLEDPALIRREDPALIGRDIALGVKPGSIDFGRTEPLRKSEGRLADETNMLFVDGLPSNCTRREVAHLFRPFIGFKEIRVVHKEARRAGDKAYVLCFVEFEDSKCALTAQQALQGYKFDDKKPDAPVLRIEFAKFPFLPPSLRK